MNYLSIFLHGLVASLLFGVATVQAQHALDEVKCWWEEPNPKGRPGISVRPRFAMPPNGVDFLDDGFIRMAADSQVTKLIRAGKATRCRDFAEQLTRDRCSLQLPDLAESVIESPQLYKNACKSIVLVCLTRPHKDHFHIIPSATGFFIANDGVFVTNHHVLEKPSEQFVFALTSDLKLHPVREVLAANSVNDAAICKFDAKGYAPISLRKGIPVGESVRVISHPAGRLFYLTDGLVSRRYARLDAPKQPGNGLQPRESSEDQLPDELHAQDGNEPGTKQSQPDTNKKPASAKPVRTRWVSISASFGSGSSGAPVFDSHGNVVGIATRTSNVKVGDKDKVSQMVFRDCVPSEVILDLVKPSSDPASEQQ